MTVGAGTPKILVSDLTKAFLDERGGERTVLSHVSFSIREGAFVSAVGPSGCGKSTLLNILAGLVPPSTGRVEFAGEPVGSGRRHTKIGYVFQQPRLLNWLTVGQNIQFALEAARVERAQWTERAQEALRLVRLEQFQNTFPLRLSGGQQQRVSIARALATGPDVVLMDEPFSHLDEISASRLRSELIEIWQRTGKTILFVTHSIPEAVLLSDTILVLGHGRLLEEFVVEAPRPRSEGDDSLFDIERRLRQMTTRWWVEAEARP